MNEKSHVGMGFAMCPVCGARHDEVVLLDRRLRNMPRESCTGLAMCEACKAKHAEGFIALIVATYVPTGVPVVQQIREGKFTGEVLHVRYTAAAQIFNIDMRKYAFTFIDTEARDKLLAMMPKPEGGE